MSEAGTLAALAATQRDILLSLKLAHELGTEELARRVYITPGAVRHHLSSLTRAGFTTYRHESDGRGRPRFIYSLTAEGEALFPTRYQDLAVALLAGLREQDPGAIRRLLELTTQDRLGRTEVRPGAGMDQRVEAVSRVLAAEGYMPTADFDREAQLMLNHCPILAAARTEPGICAAEKAYLERVAGCKVERTQYRLEGSRVCSYRFPRSNGK